MLNGLDCKKVIASTAALNPAVVVMHGIDRWTAAVLIAQPSARVPYGQEAHAFPDTALLASSQPFGASPAACKSAGPIGRARAWETERLGRSASPRRRESDTL